LQEINEGAGLMKIYFLKYFCNTSVSKKLISFTAAEGGNYHCEPKARLLREQKVLDALDENVKAK